MTAFHWVNTNETYRPESKDFMLANECVVAQYDPKKQIDEIAKNDVVFIYQNRVGIIAVGIADGKVVIQNYEGKKGEQHLMHLTDFREVHPPIPPSTISEVARQSAGTAVYFSRTVIHLSPELGEGLYGLIMRPDEPQRRARPQKAKRNPSRARQR